ncbi:MAG TPA: DHA2 family efflux MFS transporter permease subunit [Tepidiformaceae bacterium]|nr:DHA2 family efflux MFS transporter permease subunit [Tepidiformaceae bacterium]
MSLTTVRPSPSQSEPGPGSGRQDLGAYPWIAMGVVVIGTFMSILDSTIVNVALPQIGLDLHQSANIEWIVTGYLLALAVSQPATGWLADKFGRKKIFIGSMSMFCAGSLAAALSPNVGFLIGFRVLQGLGGGAMMPVGLAMVYELFPPDRRGQAMGIWGIASMAGPAVGPVLGGLIVTKISWRWLFMINVPVGIIGVTLAVLLLRDMGYREDRRFDVRGFGLAGAGLICLLLAFSEGTQWGWDSGRIIGLLAAGTGLIALFARHELRVHHPLIELRMFSNFVFSLTMVIAMVLVVAQYGRLIFMPLELETLRGMTALKVGIILTPGALGAATTMPIGGRLADRTGARLPAMIGLSVLAAMMFLLANLTVHTPIWQLMVILAVSGAGTGLAMMPMMVAALNALESRFVAQASSVRSLNRYVAGSFAVAILSTIMTAQLGSISAATARGQSPGEIQSAYNLIFWIAFGCVLATVAMTVLLPDAKKTRYYQVLRQKEQDDMEMAGMFGE